MHLDLALVRYAYILFFLLLDHSICFRICRATLFCRPVFAIDTSCHCCYTKLLATLGTYVHLQEQQR